MNFKATTSRTCLARLLLAFCAAFVLLLRQALPWVVGTKTRKIWSLALSQSWLFHYQQPQFQRLWYVGI